MALTFKGKVVIVTGGNGGIGAATVSAFLAQGANVAVFDIGESSSISNESLHYFKCDVSSEESVITAVQSVIDKLGRIDILVNNAGVMDSLESVHKVPTATWNRLFAINVNGPFFLMKAVIPHILANQTEAPPNAPPAFTHLGQPTAPKALSKGVIINVCSTAAKSGAASGAAYTASKHALLGLTRNTAWMYRTQGIRCNAILPGGTATGISSGVQYDMEGYQILSPWLNCQFPNIMQPDAQANAILWLAGPSAENVNGAELAVDNAWLAA